jgi:cell division septation protein DedD
MKRCPNCDRPTKRTLDWACQWCGYPLVSKSYKEIPKTFRQLKEERLLEKKQKSLLSEDTTTTADESIATQEDSGATSMEFTVEEIYSLCRMDKERAATLFKDRILKVTGIVASVVVDDDNDVYYVSLSSSPREEEYKVNCMFDKKNSSQLNQLTEGQTATVEGKYGDYELNILIKDCVLVHVAEVEEASLTPQSSDVTVKPTPEPEPVAEPEPEPAPEPEPVAEPEPEPAPEAEPVAELEPEPKPEPEPVAEPEPEPAQPALEVAVEELFLAYATDEVAASERFGDKLLKLTGIINRIEIQEYLEQDYINLSDTENNQLEHVRCFFDKTHLSELEQLTKGQKITVQGTFVGSIVSMHLRDCVLVS